MIAVSHARTLQSHVSSQKSLQIKATTHVGRKISLIFSGDICKAVNLCKCLTDEDLTHGKRTWYIDRY